ncbi:MAG: hypothetical protein AAGN35_05160 [Bacteroidota bacterium]
MKPTRFYQTQLQQPTSLTYCFKKTIRTIIDPAANSSPERTQPY